MYSFFSLEPTLADAPVKLAGNITAEPSNDLDWLLPSFAIFSLCGMGIYYLCVASKASAKDNKLELETVKTLQENLGLLRIKAKLQEKINTFSENLCLALKENPAEVKEILAKLTDKQIKLNNLAGSMFQDTSTSNPNELFDLIRYEQAKLHALLDKAAELAQQNAELLKQQDEEIGVLCRTMAFG